MNAPIGVDVASGVVHTVKGTAVNEADTTRMAAVRRGQQEDVFADAGYTGADKRPEHEDREVSWDIAIKRGILKAGPKALRDLAEPVERARARALAWVGHPFPSSRACSATASCAIAACSRTRRSCTLCLPWPTG
jgi:IS5 family transposase